MTLVLVFHTDANLFSTRMPEYPPKSFTSRATGVVSIAARRLDPRSFHGWPAGAWTV